MTKKAWNELNYNQRKILATIYFLDRKKIEEFKKEFHHNFDWKDTGKVYKEFLSKITQTGDGGFKIKAHGKKWTLDLEGLSLEKVSRKLSYFNIGFETVYSLLNPKSHFDDIVAYCDYCGKPISLSQQNDTGSLCQSCYDREYYGEG